MSLTWTATATRMLGGGKDQMVTVVPQNWIDNVALRNYRHAHNAGPPVTPVDGR